MNLNAEKCKEIRIDFKLVEQPFVPVLMDGEPQLIVKKEKILELVMSRTFQYNDSIRESIKKANKRLYFIVLLKRADVKFEDILKFYRSVIRPLLEYCAQAFNHSHPKYLVEELEIVQKRVLRIISPAMAYCDALEHFQHPTLSQRREDMCNNLFMKIINDQAHKLHH